ncbi:hypothetical protein [Herbiconiux sp. L3-i23]|uniref:hypothetical protein n=1 Tax=Herbiconiux sp. L3-i23 TaxID=2905871 RepID=UPI00205CF265|nr:hypothetical protein [Herbiconiux sp. L3-i23]BDI23765.1 hypothetical protein L3i23_25410 [Herbiconiux sp. L3-i23]
MPDRLNEVSDLTDLIGSWVLHASTSEFFAAHPRVTQGRVTYESSERERVAFRVELMIRNRTLRIRGRARSSQVGKAHNGRGHGARFIASRMQWRILMSADGRILSTGSAASMMTNAGTLIMARDGVSRAEVLDHIHRRYAEHGLSQPDLRDMHWREPSDHTTPLPPAARTWRGNRLARHRPVIDS